MSEPPLVERLEQNADILEPRAPLTAELLRDSASRLRAQDEEIERLRGKGKPLTRFMRHEGGCSGTRQGDDGLGTCTCGATDAIREWRAALSQTKEDTHAS